MSVTDLLRRLLVPALLVLLVAAWLLGGVTTDHTAADQWLQLLALPLVAIAGALACMEGLQGRLQRSALGVMLLIALVPALQLLPLPQAAWLSTAPRQALAADLAAAGVGDIAHRWTMSPAATEAGFWALLPALAAFLSALVVPAPSRRLLVKAVLLLVVANVLFAFFQAGLPANSSLRLYQNAGFGGLLANTNHQATALILGMVLATGQAVHAWRRQQAGRGRPHAWVVYAACATFCFLMLPFTTSRAGMAIALPALVATLFLCGALRLSEAARSKRGAAVAVVALLVALVGIRAAMGWMAVDQAGEMRHALAASTAVMGHAQAPWGSGTGSFVQVFEQNASSQFWVAGYANHAHNEYAQWWLEAGWLGALAIVLAAAVLLWAGALVMRTRGRDGHAILAASCLVAVCSVLAHSWADYPLRTSTLMTTTALLAGLLFAALADMRAGAAQAEQEALDAGEDPQAA